MPTARKAFKMGRVKGYLRGRVWYLCYFENGQRRRPRVGPDAEAARKLAAQTNAQLETGAVPVLSFEPLAVPELRHRWLDHHEHVLRSSVHTINRYRTATEHLLNFLRDERPVRFASQFAARDAETFVQYLRKIDVAPNGHKNTVKRKLLDKGIKFILESCRALFTYAAKRGHLPPYAENSFSAIEIDRIPVENSKSIVLLTAEQEGQFLEACDDWQFPLFLTLMLTGLRPGELAHLLLPDDLDLMTGVLRVRNKPKLGWQVKTRNEREIPLLPELVQVLQVNLGERTSGPVFRQRRCDKDFQPTLDGWTSAQLQVELEHRVQQAERQRDRLLHRSDRLTVARTIWRDAAAVSEDRIRVEFIQIARKAGVGHLTMPKVLRHQFATALQEGRMDPLIRNQLMGHAPAEQAKPGAGLGMTALYAHSRPETVRRQLDEALQSRPALIAAMDWLEKRTKSVDHECAA
jgi:integrase